MYVLQNVADGEVDRVSLLAVELRELGFVRMMMGTIVMFLL